MNGCRHEILLNIATIPLKHDYHQPTTNYPSNNLCM